MSWNGYPSYVCNVILRKLRERKKNISGHCLILKMMTLQTFHFKCLTLVLLERNLPKNVFQNFENVPRKNRNLFLCMIQRNLRSFAPTRTLCLFICNHMSYINLNVLDVRRNLLEKWTDVLN